MISKNGKSVLLLDPAGNLWGSEKVLLDFLKSDFAQNKNIGLCCPPFTPLAQAATELGIVVYPYFKSNLHNKGKFARFMAAIGFARACVHHKADIIYINQAGATRIGLFVGRLLKIPVVPHVRLLEDVQYIEKLDASIAAMPFVLVISKFIRDAFVDKDVKKRLKVIYDAYDIQYYSAKLQSDIKNTSICCAGRLVPMKGQDVLINAISELSNQNVYVSLDIYGTGLSGEVFEADLNKLVKINELKSLVNFKGYIENIPSKMRLYWAVVCPSHIEPLGRVIFEAWDAGSVPIAGKFSGGAAEIILASGGGILYEKQTPASLADAIKECIEMTPEKRALIIANGRQWLKQNCNPEKYSQRLLEILDEAHK